MLTTATDTATNTGTNTGTDTATNIEIRPVETKADLDAFIRLPWRLYKDDPQWVPPLIAEVKGLLSEKSNPYFGHAKARYWLALRGGTPVGRISAQIDELVQEHMGQGIGQWGMFECENDPAIAARLFEAAEGWLKAGGMTQSMGPFSLSIWDEPGLLVDGFEHPPLLMTPHHRPYYAGLVEGLGYGKAKDLYAYDLDITTGFPERIQRIVAAGEKNSRIRIRKADPARFEAEVRLVLEILNDAWSDNWGFVPLTEAEIAYAAKKMKPLVKPDLVRICEFDGVPTAFMLTLPDLNELQRDLNGRLFPFGWAKLLWRLRGTPFTQRVRVPLMGVRKELQASRNGALMAMMLIEHIRRDAVGVYSNRGELSWILEDNLPMRNILESIGCFIYKTYRIYDKPLV